MNILKLKGKLVEKNINVNTLAKTIGVDRSTLYRKLDAAEKFTIGDVNRIKEALSLTTEEAVDIFFN